MCLSVTLYLPQFSTIQIFDFDSGVGIIPTTSWFLDNDYYGMLVGGDPFASDRFELEDLM